uniref:Inositol-pentakisphosphate 2-kinase n=1 Tax=Oryzias latipes TaxID=8090 RepID=A0A3P9HEN0_ORYLA
MEVDKMDENDWKYHGEGNKSLVVCHVQFPRVLRLLKYPAADSENPPQTAEQAFRQIQNIVDFSSNVMSSMLGDKFIHSGEVVKLPLEFVRQLSIKIQQQRPAWRCDKVMDIYSGCALCLPNLTSPALHQATLTPPLCIEIKPKCGFLPSPKHVSKDIKAKVCRYCMHQHFKVASGKWKRRSLYCPLDLFSGNKQRMNFAVKHLIEEPQNNFKVFKGGQCVYSSKESSDPLDVNTLVHHLRPYFLQGNNRTSCHMTNKAILNEFIQVLINALLSGEGDEGTVTDRQEEGRSFCEASLFNRERVGHASQGLPENSVLHRILQTQMLDMLDIEGLFPLYRRVEQHLQDFPKERSRLQVDGPYNEAFLEKVQKCRVEDDGSVESAVAKVHQYRVSMTAKDCSIMVVLLPREEEKDDDEGLSTLRRLRDCRPSPFTSSVSILDLDPKPFDSIPRQLRLDQKIVSYYLRTSGALPKGSRPQPPSIISAADREECTLLFHPM